MKIRRWFVIVLLLFAFVNSTACPSTSRVEAFTARNLAYGSQGNDVYELQNRLRFIGYYWGSIDGSFGWDTYWAVRTFQYNFGMKVTGFVDMATKMRLVNATKTWKYNSSTSSGTSSKSSSSGQTPAQTQSSAGSSSTNKAALSQSPPVVNGLSQADMQLIAHVVYGEARGEAFIGQVGIAAVVLNRLHDPRFPHSVPAIIYQPGAFTAVSDGQVNLQPDATAMKAVLDAVHGWDPVLGAVYYFNPATATSPWIWSRPQIIKIGNHIFCR